jgi:transposase InsO family protein
MVKTVAKSRVGSKPHNDTVRALNNQLHKARITNNSNSNDEIFYDKSQEDDEVEDDNHTAAYAASDDEEPEVNEEERNYQEQVNTDPDTTFPSPLPSDDEAEQSDKDIATIIPIEPPLLSSDLFSTEEMEKWSEVTTFKSALAHFVAARALYRRSVKIAKGKNYALKPVTACNQKRLELLNAYRNLGAVATEMRGALFRLKIAEELKELHSIAPSSIKGGTVNITTTHSDIKKLSSFKRKSIIDFTTTLGSQRALNVHVDRMSFITQDVQDLITQTLRILGLIEESDSAEWEDWSDEKLFDPLLKYLAETSPTAIEIHAKMKKIVDGTSPLHITDWDNIPEHMRVSFGQFIDGLRKEQIVLPRRLDNSSMWKDKRQLKIYTDYLLNDMDKRALPASHKLYISLAISSVKTLKEYSDNSKLSFCQLYQLITERLQYYATFAKFNDEHGFTQTGSGSAVKVKDGKRKIEETGNSEPTGPKGNPTPKNDRVRCAGCGGHHTGKCLLTKHPNWNKTDKPWATSTIGVFMKTHNLDQLPWNQQRDGTSNNLIPYHNTVDKPKRTNFGHKKPRSKCHLCTLNSTLNTNPLLSAHVIQANEQLQVRALLDTGAEHGSYMNSRVAKWLQCRGLKTVDSNKVVCSCFGDCKMIDKCILATVTFDVNKFSPSKTIKFWIIDELPYDLVIGNQDIEASWLSVTTTEKEKVSCEVKTGISDGGSSGHPTCKPIGKVPRDTAVSRDNAPVHYSTGQVIIPGGGQPKLPSEKQSLIHVSKILDYEPDAFGIPDKWDSLDEFLNADPLMIIQDESVKLPTHIDGTPELQKDIKALLIEFSDIFRTDVSPQHADVPAMDIKVDRQKWNCLKGVMGVSPRTQSNEKNVEIQRQVEKMLAAGVIKKSEANRYCQVLLVPKPDGKKRFCIDYTPLNSCCEGEGWNLPNISQTLRRIGTHKPKLFAVMDFTSGYHQAPLSASSQIFTAFICWVGVFQWGRVPMGLKGAAGYFQRVMATVVLLGLLYYICELYIDDVVVYAQDAASFLSRLRQVFERFRKHNVSLNPDKCRFGMRSVEYVGHTIDETGLSFSAEKLDEVLQIEPPQHGKELRSFLGLASYFRDHIENLATIAKPLQDMLLDYDKKRKLVWNPQSEQAFLAVKDAIRRCPKLFFMDDNAPVYLHTDASDYGISGYLFQIIDGKELPIAFMSKTLSAEEVRWSVIEKECYAIVVSFRKFEYLIRDKHFTLRTDHKNLTYVNDPPSPKVRRWKITLQEYDFSIEHISGKENIVADAFSRLLPISAEMLCILKGNKLPQDKYKLLSSVHNTVVGHHGVERMITKLRTLNHEWKEMREHARTFIDNCPCCQKMSNIRVAIKTHPFKLATTRPMEVIHMDTLYMGITNDNGDAYLLVLIDSCSRWLEMYPIPNLSAETAAIKVFEYFGRYGRPGLILSDNGSQFINKLHDELYLLTGVTKEETTPYSHEENGIVERANKEILRHVRSILFDKGIHKEWHTAIPLVQRILNSTKSSITGCTPAELVLSNSANLERGIYMNQVPSSLTTESLSQWHNKRIALQQLVLASANKYLLEREGEKLTKASGTKTEYAINSYVLLRMPDEDITKSNVGKLKLPLKGPMLVMAINGDKYTLQDITTGKDYQVHISRLSPFYFDPIRDNPSEIAQKDHDEEQVEKVVDHTNVKLKSKMDFRVRWTGYNDSHDLWLPWNQLRDNPKLHKYLFDNGMESWIPKEHRKQEYKG